MFPEAPVFKENGVNKCPGRHGIARSTLAASGTLLLLASLFAATVESFILRAAIDEGRLYAQFVTPSALQASVFDTGYTARGVIKRDSVVLGIPVVHRLGRTANSCPPLMR